jgi:hypothetical protein
MISSTKREMNMTFDTLALWTGRGILLAGGWFIMAWLTWQAIEVTLTLFRVKKLVLQYAWDRMIAKKAD